MTMSHKPASPVTVADPRAEKQNGGVDLSPAVASVTSGLPVLPPLAALGEIAFLFAAIYGLDWAFPALGLFDLSPHPFWLPVLLVSLQYGTVSGFIAALTAIGLALFAGLPEQDIGENLFSYFVRVWGQPILWITVALLVGQFRMRQLALKRELRAANASLTQQRDNLVRHADGLRARIERLEQELSARYRAPPHHVAGVLRAAALGGGMVGDGAGERFVTAASALFPSATLSLYELRHGRLVEQAVYGRKPDTARRIDIGPEDALYKAAFAGGRSVSVLDPEGEIALAGAGLAAIPVIDAESQRPAGMVVLEQADPIVLSAHGMAAIEQFAAALSPRDAGVRAVHVMETKPDAAATEPRRRTGLVELIGRSANAAQTGDERPAAHSAPQDKAPMSSKSTVAANSRSVEG